MNSLRIEGQKTVGIEIVQQFDWEVPDVIIIPGGNLGNVSALGSGLLMMRDLGVITRLPRIVVAQAESANPLYRSYLKNFASFEPMQAQKTLASAIQIGNPVSIEKAIRTLKQFNGIVRTPRSRNWPMPPPWAIGPACSIARTPAWPWPR